MPRSNSSVMLAKSRPKLTMSSRVTVRARFAAGPRFAEGLELFRPVKILRHTKAHHLRPAQNMATSVSTSLLTSASS
jgi:hypothetical protein